MPGSAPLLLASNRGPVSFALDDDGSLSMRRGAGGLVSALSCLEAPQGTLWVCAALSEADRAAVAQAREGRIDLRGDPEPARPAGREGDGAPVAVRMLAVDPRVLHRAYNGIANSTLWFLHHRLWASPLQPVFDATWRREWDSYADYNDAFADALAQEAAPRARVLVQDYHLSLVPGLLRERRPDLRIAHFSHTPWAPPDYYCLLPREAGRTVLRGVLGADHAGFLAPPWAAAFLDCCEQVLGAQVDRERGTVTHEGRTTVVGVHPLGVDAEMLRERAGRGDVSARRATLEAQVGTRRVVLRIDRTELSKNIVRGFLAYRELLRMRPEWIGQVVHVAFAYPSRHDLPEYREYTAAVLRLADEINEEFGTSSWSPILLQVDDDYARSLAAFRMADVLVVNPVRDGMNLVAKEGPVLAKDDGCALILSWEAGAATEMSGDALMVNPYDVSETALALHEALSMPTAERRRRTDALAAASAAHPPTRWLGDQIDALD